MSGLEKGLGVTALFTSISRSNAFRSLSNSVSSRKRPGDLVVNAMVA
jgi:hypothetical protein